MELHTMVEELPSGAVGEMFPVVVATTGVAMAPNAAVGVIMDVGTVLGTADGAGTGIAAMVGDGSGGGAGGCGTGMVEPGKSDVDDVAGCADRVRNGVAVLPGEVAGTTDVGAAGIDGIVTATPAADGKEVTGTAGVPGVTCPVGVEQVTTVPGVVGSEANGSGASVVSGTPDWVVAENGLGPLSGEVTIAAGVDGRPMAVVPMVETCAGLALQPNSRATAVNSKRRIAIASSVPV
jgi:hypothetical protein